LKYKIPDIKGWMLDVELDWLYETSKTMNSILEIGSWKGRSTHALLSGCTGPVFAVDHFTGDSFTKTISKETDVSNQFWKNVGHFPNLCIIRMDSIQASKFFREKSIDMIFIDGCHETEAMKADTQAWKPICKKLLCGHDYGWESVSTALKEMKMTTKVVAGTIWSEV
jgi:predicted O-methyltransferase YrrM